MAFVGRYGDILPEFVREARHTRMHIRNGRKDFEEEALRRLMLQKQIWKRRDVRFRVFESLEREHVVADPVGLHADDAITVEERTAQPLQAAFAKVEQKRQWLVMVGGCRVRDVACGNEAFFQ